MEWKKMILSSLLLFAAFFMVSDASAEELACSDYETWSPEPDKYIAEDEVVWEGVVYACGLRDANAYHWCNESWAEPGTWWGDLAWTEPEICE